MTKPFAALAAVALLTACSAVTGEYEGSMRFEAGPETSGAPRTFRVQTTPDAFGSDDPKEYIEEQMLESGQLVANHQEVCAGAVEAVAYGHESDGTHWMTGRCAAE